MTNTITLDEPEPGLYQAAIGNHSAVSNDPFHAVVLLLNRAYEAGFRLDAQYGPLAVVVGPPAPAPVVKEPFHAT